MSLLIVTIGVFPFLDSFAYTKKNIILHLVFGILIAFVNTKIGFNGLIDNIFYIVALVLIYKKGFKDFLQKHSEMDDMFGHNIVKKANYLLIFAYFVTYLIMNVKFV